MSLGVVASIFMAFIGAAEPCDTWVNISPPRALPCSPTSTGIAFDDWRGVLVWYAGSCGTYESDGLEWRKIETAVSPPGKGPLVFDSSRGVTVFVTQAPGSSRSQTWEWDGSTWVLKSETGPAPRIYHAVAFDHERSAVILHGGLSGTQPMSDLWEWNGSEWTQLLFPGAPPARFGHGLAFDSKDSKLILFGGKNQNELYNDLWELSDSSWSQRASSGTWPPGQAFHGMSYDVRREIVIASFGEQCAGTSCGPRSQVWSWNGNTWKETWLNSNPKVHSATYDSVRELSLLLAGSNLWTWDDDSLIPADGSSCGERKDYAIAYDSDRAVTILFGGIYFYGVSGPRGDTWSWNGERWTWLSQTGPERRHQHVMSYIDHAKNTVLFGGFQSGRILDDTWQWDGQKWSALDVIGPSRRYSAAIAYDRSRQVALLFGGFNGWGGEADTWSWDGESWTLVSTSGPSARWDHKMTYDSTLEQIILYGGRDTTAVYGDMWAWDGSNWKLIGGGPARYDHALSFDSSRGRLLVIGGRSRQSTTVETWEWDGEVWHRAADFGSWGLDAIFDEPNNQTIVPYGYSTFAFTGCPLDSDDDGILDPQDECPHSDLAAFVEIDDCTTDVENQLLQGGCTMNDRINACVDTDNDDGKKCIRLISRQWLHDELITRGELRSIHRCLRARETKEIETRP